MAPLTEQHWTEAPEVRDDPRLRGALDLVAASASVPVDPATRLDSLEAVLRASAANAATPTGRGRRARRVLALTTAQLVLLGGATAAAATGGLAAAGALPAPVQQVVHEVGARVGIGVPAAPGQVAKHTDRPAHEHAPGRRAERDGDPTTTGKTYAPGQVGRQDGERPGRPDHAGTRGRPDHAGGAPGAEGSPEGR